MIEKKNKLQIFLETNEIPQRDFAKMVNISTSQLNKLLKQGKAPSLKVALKIQEKTLNKVSVHDWEIEKT